MSATRRRLCPWDSSTVAAVCLSGVLELHEQAGQRAAAEVLSNGRTRAQVVAVFLDGGTRPVAGSGG